MTSLLLRHPIKIFEFKVKWGQKIGVWLRVFSGKLIQNRWNGRFWNFGAWLRLIRGKLIQNHNFWEFLKMSKIGVWLRLFSGKLIQTFFSTFFKFYYKLRQKKPPDQLMTHFRCCWRTMSPRHMLAPTNKNPSPTSTTQRCKSVTKIMLHRWYKWYITYTRLYNL